MPGVPSSPPQPQQSTAQQKANGFPRCLPSAYGGANPPAPLAAAPAELLPRTSRPQRGCCKTSPVCLGVPAGSHPAHGEERGGQRWSCTTRSGPAARLLQQHPPDTAAAPQPPPRSSPAAGAARCQAGVPSRNLPVTVPWNRDSSWFFLQPNPKQQLVWKGLGDENMSSPRVVLFLSNFGLVEAGP